MSKKQQQQQSVLGPQKTNTIENVFKDKMTTIVEDFFEEILDNVEEPPEFFTVAEFGRYLKQMRREMVSSVERECVDIDDVYDKPKLVINLIHQMVDSGDISQVIDHFVDDEVIAERAADLPGYMLIKVESMDDEQKLKEFVNENICPHNIGASHGLA